MHAGSQPLVAPPLSPLAAAVPLAHLVPPAAVLAVAPLLAAPQQAALG